MGTSENNDFLHKIKQSLKTTPESERKREKEKKGRERKRKHLLMMIVHLSGFDFSIAFSSLPLFLSPFFAFYSFILSCYFLAKVGAGGWGKGNNNNDANRQNPRKNCAWGEQKLKRCRWLGLRREPEKGERKQE